MDPDFHRHFMSDGGAFDPQILSDHIMRGTFVQLQKSAENFIRSFRSHSSLVKSVPEIKFGFLHCLELGAKAKRTAEGVYYIGLNSGSVLLMYDTFYRMLSHKEILTEIGDCDRENISHPSLPGYHIDALWIKNKSTIDDTELLPKDPTRYCYARHLADLALNFLLVHELNHVAHGHLDLKINLGGHASHSEKLKRRIDYNEYVFHQTLEFDADCVAVAKSLRNAISRWQGVRPPSALTKQFHQSFEMTIWNWSFAVMTMVRIMLDGTFYSFDGCRKQKHPLPRLRQALLLSTVFQYLIEYFPTELKLINREKLVGILVRLEQIFEKITGNKQPVEEVKLAMQNIPDYLKIVHEEWKELYPSLKDLAYVELVKPSI
jgi:hypothetical protein